MLTEAIVTGPIRVLLVDDHGIVRKGLRALLKSEADIQVVGEAANGAEAVAQARTLKPDVVLMDLIMPKMNGVEATWQISLAQPEARVLVLTGFASDDLVFPAIKAGALGFLLKDSSPDDLLQAIHQVHQGEPSLDATIALKVLEEVARPVKISRASSELTECEEQVLRLIALGKSNRDIAALLCVELVTVRRHVTKILAKLHIASRTQAALYALKEGLASVDDIPPMPLC